MNLIIVESPAKGRTIEKMLGKDFKVIASYGHVRDLPQKKLGVDIKKDFEPEYVISPKAKRALSVLKREIARADSVYLATDFDREGEAIAWHIIKATGPKDQNIQRITFHEITKPAILEALKHPRDIDIHLVDAQQARRILDRLVGYKLSPFLWQKVAQGLSAGRVQSVAVRLVVEREREIKNFKPQEFWQIEVILSKKNDSKTFKALLEEINDKKIGKFELEEEDVEKIVKDLKSESFEVKDIQSQEKKRYPSPPFTTSTLQQEAARKLAFSAKKTMKLAQDLYEDGLITYMRTDSVQVSSLALKAAREVIGKEYGEKYALHIPRFYKTKTKGAQEAHEAIRPTDLKIARATGGEYDRLYTLIRKRMLASQMKEAEILETKAKIAAGKTLFSATGNILQFDGFLKIYNKGEENGNFLGQTLPKLEVGENLTKNALNKNQQFTEPPARFSEGTLVRELEKRGIGRPSTYAPTISTIIERGYVEKNEGKLVPKEVGEIVNDILVEHFPDITDYNFTAEMEENLDNIAEGKLLWKNVLRNFYGPFSTNLEKKTLEVAKKSTLATDIGEKCPECGKNLSLKLGRYGKFLACSGFPKCKFTKPYLEKGSTEQRVSKPLSKEKCPDCGKGLAIKEGKFGKFLACTGYPKCKFTKNIQIPSKVKCPNCGGKILQKRTRKGKIFWGCNGYPKCKTAFWDEPQEKDCPKCKSILTLNSKSKVLKCSQCDFNSKN